MRAVLTAIVTGALSALLAGCWGAETPLFGRADWVQPPGLAGEFTSEDASGKPDGTVMLVRRADGLIDGTPRRQESDAAAPQTSPAGFVAIPGGASEHFLMVVRAPAGETARGRPAGEGRGELYLIARWHNDRLDTYWPRCGGTQDLSGMTRQSVEMMGEQVCAFTSRDAVLKAALMAERELLTKRLFQPQVLGRLRYAGARPITDPDSQTDTDTAEPEAEADAAPAPQP